MAEFYPATVKATFLLKENISTLIRLQGHERKALLMACGRVTGRTMSNSWLSKALSDPKRSIPLKYLDVIAEFFGVEPYQMLQPGINDYTERRSGKDRRGGTDRRMTDAERVRAMLGSEHMKAAAALVTKRASEVAGRARKTRGDHPDDTETEKRRRRRK